MVSCLIFIAGLVTGGGVAVMLLSCLQINRVNDYKSEIRKLRNKLNNK